MIVISFCPENECGVLGASAFAAQLLGDSLKTVHWTVFALQCRAAPYLGEGVADKTAARERAAGERRSEDLGARGRLPPP